MTKNEINILKDEQTLERYNEMRQLSNDEFMNRCSEKENRTISQIIRKHMRFLIFSKSLHYASELCIEDNKLKVKDICTDRYISSHETGSIRCMICHSDLSEIGKNYFQSSDGDSVAFRYTDNNTVLYHFLDEHRDLIVDTLIENIDKYEKTPIET